MILNPNPMAQLLRFFHVVGGVENGHAFGIELFGHIQNSTPRLRINAHRWLIHKEYLRTVEQPRANIYPAFHTARIGINTVIGALAQTNLFEHFFHAVAQRLALHVIHLAPKVQILARAQAGVEGNLLRHNPDQALGSQCRRADGVRTNHSLTASGTDQSTQHADGGALARAIGT